MLAHEAARYYASRGWRIVPARLGVKYPSVKEWQTVGTTDATQIGRWFPDSYSGNVCIVTGQESNLWVLDVDTKPGKVGARSLADLEEEYGALPPTREIRTWSGGRHLYFTWDGVDFDLRNRVGAKGQSRLGKDLDVRGNGGQVVAPPSMAEGQPYELLHDRMVAQAPGWLLELLRPVEQAPAAPAGADVTPERMISIGKAALDRAVLDIRVSAAGTRNQTINDCAYTIGRLVARGCLTEATAEEAILRAAETVGHGNEMATIRSGLRSGMKNPKTPWPPADRPKKARPAPAAAGGGGSGGGRVVVSPDRPVRGEWPDEFTDDANARLFARWAAGEVRYVAERGAWVKWDGARWAFEANDDGPTKTWLDIAREWKPDELDEDLEGDDLKEAEKWIAAQAGWRKSSLMASGASHCLRVAQGRPELSSHMDDFDQRATELNTPGGIIDLETGFVTPNRSDHMHTQITGVERKKGRAVVWESFLRQTFDGFPEVAEYVQRLAGYSATGVQSEAVFPFLHGEGANGKSVLMDVFGRVLGGYSITTPAEFLMAGKSQHEQAIARLAGRRLAVASEVNERDRFDEAKLKNQTGGDVQTGRFMRENSFDFRPTHHLWLHGNHLPRVAAGGHGVWRRLRLIKFLNVMPVESQDGRLADRLVEEEGPQILAWIVEGAVMALSGGLRTPQAVMDWTTGYAAEEDDVALFLDEKTVRQAGAWISCDDLYRAFAWWSEASGEKYPLKKPGFGRRLTALGLATHKKRINGIDTRGWNDVMVPGYDYGKRDRL